MTAERKQQNDEDMQKATAALTRAAMDARKLARQTGTPIVVVRNGKLISEIPPADEPEEIESA